MCYNFKIYQMGFLCSLYENMRNFPSCTLLKNAKKKNDFPTSVLKYDRGQIGIVGE